MHEYHVETLGGKTIHIHSYPFISIHIHSYPFISIHIHSYPFISIHSLHFIVFHCISLLSCQSCGRVCSKQANSQAPICHKSSLRTPGGTTSWIHWALRCPHGCLQEETNSCHWCVQLLQCLLGVPDWQRSLSNGKPGAAARGDGTLGLIRECPATVTMDLWMSQN